MKIEKPWGKHVRTDFGRERAPLLLSKVFFFFFFFFFFLQFTVPNSTASFLMRRVSCRDQTPVQPQVLQALIPPGYKPLGSFQKFSTDLPLIFKVPSKR
jgi:hypothetical protein